MENLSKENTWNELEIQFPKELKDFFDWIDHYKVDNDWDKLFKKDWLFIGSLITESDGTRSHIMRVGNSPKFHDIPFEMQMGVIIAYFSEQEVLNDTMFISCSNIPQFKKFLQDRFNMIKINNDLEP